MAYAQAANKETCAGKDCHHPVEIEIPRTGIKMEKGTPIESSAVIGYCLECAIDLK